MKLVLLKTKQMCVLMVAMLHVACTKKFVVRDANLKSPVVSENMKFLIVESLNLTEFRDLDRLSEIMGKYWIRYFQENLKFANHPKLFHFSNESEMLNSLEYMRTHSFVRQGDILHDDKLMSSSDFFFRKNDVSSTESGLSERREMLMRHAKGLNQTSKKNNDLARYSEIFFSNRANDLDIMGVGWSNKFIHAKRMSVEVVDKPWLSEVNGLDEILLEKRELKQYQCVLLSSVRHNRSVLELKIQLGVPRTQEIFWKKTFHFKKEDFMVNLTEKLNLVGQEVVDVLYKPKKGLLQVNTIPEGAIVFLDGERKGMSNLTMEYPTGLYRLAVFKRGRGKVLRDIFVLEDQSTILNINLEPEKKDFFDSVNIRSNPEGGRIWLNDNFVGETPWVNDRPLPFGEYKIRIEKEGYKMAWDTFSLNQDSEGGVITREFELKLGQEEYIEPDILSKPFNITKNIFLFSSIVSLAPMFFAFAETEKYHELGYQQRKSSSDVLGFQQEFQRQKMFRNMMLGITLSCLLLTVAFQIMEMEAESVPIGYRKVKQETEKDSKETDLKDIAFDYSVLSSFMPLSLGLYFQF